MGRLQAAHASVISRNISGTVVDKVPESTYEPFPRTFHWSILRGPNAIATAASGTAKPSTARASPSRPRRLYTRYSTGSSVAAPVCFARLATATATPDDVLRPRRASSTAAVIAGSMKISKLAA